MMEEQNDYEYIQSKISHEGFDYCFDGYSDWKEVKDEKFHNLRNAYLKSKQALENYLEMKAKDPE